jgi:hypothetical protein
MPSAFGLRSLLDLPAEIRIRICRYFFYTSESVETHWSILGTSREEVPVNLAFRFAG